MLNSEHSLYHEWTAGRTPAVIGTNAGSAPLAFQNWRKFKEAFVPELIARAVRETEIALGRGVNRCLDPFAGSGTTPLACQFLGVEPVAIEVNPFLADLVEAKLTVLDVGLVSRRCAEAVAFTPDIEPCDFFAAAPATFVEPGLKDRFLFSRPVALRLAQLNLGIARVPEGGVRRLLRVLLASSSLEVCNAKVSGKGRRYRRNWQSNQKTPHCLVGAFVSAVEEAVFDLARFSQRPNLSFNLLRGDARRLINQVGPIDLAVFSPPYPNSFDYTDVYNVELWAAGYLAAKSDNRELREATLRSHVQIKRSFSTTSVEETVRDVTNKLRGLDSLWNRNIPDMIEAYFDDLRAIIVGAGDRMPEKGRVYMVVGDSKYGGVEVPVASILTGMAQGLSFKVVSTEPFRSMRSSPQQGGQPELAETLIVLQKE